MPEPEVGARAPEPDTTVLEPEALPEPEPEDPEPEEPTYQRFDVRTHAAEALAAAAAAVKAGECIVLPTDTVYGIGANAADRDAVQRLLDAKERGRDMPPPVLIADGRLRAVLAQEAGDYADRMAEVFWPGALTLIFEKQDGLRMDLGETKGTIAIRVPDHDFARQVLRRTGPQAVSSANVSGQPAALTVDEAIAQLGNRVSVYLDAGPTPGPVPSTIVDFSESHYGEIVRVGVLTAEQLREVDPFLNDPFEQPADEPASGDDEAAEPADASEVDSAAEPGGPPPAGVQGEQTGGG